MPKITLQKPLDQLSGKNRFLDQLKQGLNSSDYKEFKFIVAFAKIGPFLRLDESFQEWNKKGKKIKGIFGVDQQGTSFQALDFSLNSFKETHIVHVPSGIFNPTFHPKIYLFIGPKKALAFIGSNNFTVGGTETNLEANIKLELTFPEDKELLLELNTLWEETKQISLPLNKKMLLELLKSEIVVDERKMIKEIIKKAVETTSKTNNKKFNFPKLQLVPPTPIPKKFLSVKPKKKLKGRTKEEVDAIVKRVLKNLTTQALAIQIKPHPNGEVLLSKKAVDQNPEFFGWPFTGKTTPKKDNPPYPQREPDPIVNIRVFDKKGEKIIENKLFSLNTVYYAKRSEIRITMPPDVIKATPRFSMMVMSLASQNLNYDYDIDIFIPGNPQYNNYLSHCKHTMPSGGDSSARKFGWF